MNLQADLDKIERAIERAGISKSEFFRRAGITPTTWYRWRSGNGSVPGMRLWLRVQQTARDLKGMRDGTRDNAPAAVRGGRADD